MAIPTSMPSELKMAGLAGAEPVREGFWVALIVHGLALLGVFLMIWWQGRPLPEEELHVFELVSTGELAEVPVEAARTAPPPSPAPRPVTVPALNLAPLQPLPEIRQPDPVPAPPVAAPRPTPTPTPRPDRPTPTPAPTPAPAVTPPPTMSLEDFRREHGRPPPQSNPAPRPRPAPNAGIDTAAIRRNLQQLGDLRETSAPAARRTAAQQSELDTWAAEIKRRLDAAWARPDGLGSRYLSVRISFTVEINGRLTGVQVATSSGEPTLDNSVLAAFRSASPVRPPPDGARRTYTMTFELKP